MEHLIISSAPPKLPAACHARKAPSATLLELERVLRAPKDASKMRRALSTANSAPMVQPVPPQVLLRKRTVNCVRRVHPAAVALALVQFAPSVSSRTSLEPPNARAALLEPQVTLPVVLSPRTAVLVQQEHSVLLAARSALTVQPGRLRIAWVRAPALHAPQARLTTTCVKRLPAAVSHVRKELLAFSRLVLAKFVERDCIKIGKVLLDASNVQPGLLAICAALPASTIAGLALLVHSVNAGHACATLARLVLSRVGLVHLHVHLVRLELLVSNKD